MLPGKKKFRRCSFAAAAAVGIILISRFGSVRHYLTVRWPVLQFDISLRSAENSWYFRLPVCCSSPTSKLSGWKTSKLFMYLCVINYSVERRVALKLLCGWYLFVSFKKNVFFVVKLDSPFYLQNKITLTMQMNSSQFRRLSQQVVQMNFHLKNEFLCKVGTKANFLPKHLTNWRPFAKIILLPRKHSYTFRQSFAMTTGIAANSEGHRHLFARNLGSDFQA